MRSFILIALLCSFAVAAVAGEAKLPPPQKTGGPSVLEAIDRRGSEGQSNFPAGKVGPQELSTILWAASGLNRDGSKWTVPMAMGRPPYVKIHVVDADGASLYNWKNHSLVQVNNRDVRPEVAAQGFAKTVPALLILAFDGDELAKFGNNPFGDEFGAVLVGAMAQNIYLASESVGVGARLIYGIDRDKAAASLRLAGNDKAICAVLLGKK